MPNTSQFKDILSSSENIKQRENNGARVLILAAFVGVAHVKSKQVLAKRHI